MNTLEILKSFLEDIDNAKNISKDEVIISLISQRLDKCLNSYIINLNKDIQYLKDRNQINLIRKINK